MARRRSASIALFVLVAAGCSHDFDQFEVGGDASSVLGPADGAAPADATAGPDGSVITDGGDAGGPACAGRAACLSSATTCGTNCNNAAATCNAGCPNGQPGKTCRQDCDAKLSTCKASCTTTCDNCLQSAGCPTPNACRNALP
jgi:hypothetical protein